MLYYLVMHCRLNYDSSPERGDRRRRESDDDSEYDDDEDDNGSDE